MTLRYPHVNVTVYNTVKNIFGFLISLLSKGIEIEGLENFPLAGGVLIISNHLSFFDTVIAYRTLPRVMYALTGEKYKNSLWRFITDTGGAIYVNRGEVDREALRQAFNVIEDGLPLVVAPEGTRSKTGGLLPGKPGASYIAARASVPIVPMVFWNTDKVIPGWRKFQRTRIHLKFGKAFRLPEGRARSEDLDRYTEDMMLRLAAMLPESYRGVYRDHPRLGEFIKLLGEENLNG
jgi:1-acyl-sn-glycerol-3-phosphate acyltransferase